MTTWLHQERFAGVLAALQAAGARRVIDLGCGAGDFLLPLAGQPWVAHVTGVEQAGAPLAALRTGLAAQPDAVQAKVRIVEGSVLDPARWRAGFDAAVMVEVIEHLDPSRLSVLEAALFRPPVAPLVILTTPNADFNSLLGVPAGRFRHPDHRFEWGRARFGGWAQGVAMRTGTAVTLSDLGGKHPVLGGASQMAVFVRQA